MGHDLASLCDSQQTVRPLSAGGGACLCEGDRFEETTAKIVPTPRQESLPEALNYTDRFVRRRCPLGRGVTRHPQ